MLSKSHKLVRTLPAWALVAVLVGLGAGCTTWWQPPTYSYNCGGPCAYRVQVDVDQENFGNGNYRDNFADAQINYTGAGYYSYRGGLIDVDQENVGYGHERNNIGYATIDGGSYHQWASRGKIDIDQDNYGNGNNRDNAAFATWSW